MCCLLTGTSTITRHHICKIWLKRHSNVFRCITSLTPSIDFLILPCLWSFCWWSMKDPHFKAFMHKLERYLCKFTGNGILETSSTSRAKGGLGLINIKERIQTIQVLEYLNEDLQTPETNNVLFDVGLHQKTLGPI